ncbi:MAG: HAMP domain-containing histidine kinase [Polyangiaceae bacterium]|nr:HAMP domain-containing histidine kinase [Polyangiaceae bacterium]
MSPLAAAAFHPAWALAFAVGLVALRLGRARGVGLALLCFTQGLWITGLLLFTTESTTAIAERVLPAGILEAAGFVHAATNLEGIERPRLVASSWIVAGAIALVGAIFPRLLYGPGARGAGPLFVPLAIVATLVTIAMLLWLVRGAMREEGARRKRLAALALGAVLGSLGGGGTVALFVTGVAPAWIAAPFMFVSIALAAFALLDREEGRARRLVRTGLFYAFLTAVFTSVGLTLYSMALAHLVPDASTPLALFGWGVLVTFFATLPLDPLRQLVVEGVGRKLVRDPIGVRDLADAVEASEARAEHSARLAELGTVVSAVAHEIRNPLGVLLAQAKLLEKGGAPPERVAAIRAQVDRARRFVDDLLRYGKPRAIDPKRTKILSLVERAVNDARAAFGEGAPEVAVKGDAGTTADVDAAALGDVVTVLVTNAFAALSDAGAAPNADWSEAPVVVSVDRRPHDVTITVEDRGPGVPPEIEARLFEPFVTGRGRDSKHPGTGLGLAIAARWVERHGGSLSYERAGHGGARFIVRLPREVPLVLRSAGREGE